MSVLVVEREQKLLSVQREVHQFWINGERYNFHPRLVVSYEYFDDYIECVSYDDPSGGMVASAVGRGDTEQEAFGDFVSQYDRYYRHVKYRLTTEKRKGEYELWNEAWKRLQALLREPTST